MTRLGTDGMSVVTQGKKGLCCSARGRIWMGSYSDPPALAIKRVFVPKMLVSYMLKIPLFEAPVNGRDFSRFMFAGNWTR